MTDEVRVMTRAESIPNFKSPDGKQWRILRSGDTAMYEVVTVRVDEFDNEVPDRRAHVPEQFKSLFTSVAKAQKSLTQFLIARWDESDEATAKLNKKAVKRDAA
jgi:hypothetical protein